MRLFFLALICYITSFSQPILMGDIVSIDGEVAKEEATFKLLLDLTFTVETAGDWQGIVFDEWTIYDGTIDFAYFINLQWHRNDGPLIFTGAGLRDNGDFNPNDDITDNDGILFLILDTPVLAGDVITIKAGIWDLSSSTADFNPLLNNSNFNGKVFLTDDKGDRMSNFGNAVPEPSSVFGIGFLALMIAGTRRRYPVH